MLKSIILILILCAAAILGPWLADSQGYVHIATAGYIIETSLTTACILLAVGFAVLYFACSFLARVLHIPTWIRRWLRRHGEDKSRSLQDRAYLAYEEGDYAETLALISRSDHLSDMPVKSLFIGAKSAFELEKYDLATKYLDEAEKKDDESKAAAAIIRARLNLRIGNAKAALENLDKVKSGYHNRLVSKMYYNAHLQEDDLDSLYAGSARLVRDRVITADEAQEILGRWFEASLRTASDGEAMARIWKKLPKQEHTNPEYTGPFVNKLLQLGEVSRARSLTLDQLGSDPSPEFLETISTWDISVPEVLQRLEDQAERTEKATGSISLPLLKALGNLELRAGKLEAARARYEKALELSATPDIFFKLGEILTAQQQFAEATERYTRGAQLQESTVALTVRE